MSKADDALRLAEIELEITNLKADCAYLRNADKRRRKEFKKVKQTILGPME